MLLGYLLAAFISIPIRHLAFGDVQSFSTWLTLLLGFRAIYYGCTKELCGFALVMLVMTAFPGATPMVAFPGYWRFAYPLTYYILGALIRRIQPEINPWLGIAGAIMVSAFLGAATVQSTDGNLSEAFTWEFADLWITIITLFLFTALYRVKLPATFSHLLAFGAGGCYGGYLLSHLFDAWCYKLVPHWKKPEKYALIFICITIPIFLTSILLGVLLERTVKSALLRRKGASKCPR